MMITKQPLAKLSTALAIHILFWASIPAAFAMGVEPLVLDMTSVGIASKQSFKVSNSASNPLPVEIAVTRIEIDPNGKQTTSEAGNNFLIFPPQVMIPPGGVQVFRVQWVGDGDIKKSQTYRFSTSQIPVQLPDQKSGIQIVMSFGVTVNVAPPDGQSQIVVVGAKPAKSKDGRRLATLTVKNLGNKHAYLRDSVITLSASAWSEQLTPYEFAQKVGLGIVQPGKERRFFLPIEVPADVSAITAKVAYKPKK